MAEPIRKPVHRPRPPHPHVPKRPHAVLVRSRLLPAEPDLEETRQPQTAPTRPALVPAPPPPPLPVTPMSEPVTPPPAAFAPRAPEERSARGLLLTALALHLAVLLATWFAQPASDLEPADLLLAGTVLLSGGLMLVLGGARRS